MKRRFSKEHALFTAALVSALAVWSAMVPTTPESFIRAVISGQRQAVRNINDPRSTTRKEELLLDVIDFPPGDSLTHRTLGPLGYRSDFFIDLSASFEVIVPGEYEFRIASDDGFQLLIDGALVVQFEGDRPFGSTSGSIALAPGAHHLEIRYFQGYGNLGLQAYYTAPGEEPQLIGVSSESLRFRRVG